MELEAKTNEIGRYMCVDVIRGKYQFQRLSHESINGTSDQRYNKSNVSKFKHAVSNLPYSFCRLCICGKERDLEFAVVFGLEI